MSAALPAGKPWGVGRADAVGMILNRLAGLDIGPAPDHLIPRNIRQADAPVRYPFLWNATVQNKTQWPGFAPNGNDLFGLIRNLGEVYGVFGVLYPERRAGWVGGIDYISTNSGNFPGLDRVEQMARRIGKPVWPWSVDRALSAQGEKLYARRDQTGQSCASCHGIVVQQVPLLPATWKTPLFDVHTDFHEYDTLAWDGNSGVLEGGYLLLPINRIKPRDSLVAMLSIATAGAILQKAGLDFDRASTSLSMVANNPKKNQPLVVNAIRAPASLQASAAPSARYESRVMEGIWAAAPYLHNGSVPTLADLLEPSDRRPARFDVGADYDTARVGLAATQSGLHSTTETTGCDDRGSGNSRCGHDFATGWTPNEKRALLEYLKIL
jgi:mono/diheme cytochrome c family protein